MTPVQDFIISAAEKFFGLPATEEQKHDVDALNDFIYNPHTLLLQIFIKSDQTFSFLTKIQGGVNKCLIFYKTSAIDLNSEDAINYINIITMTTDAAESLYQILRQIYSPLLAIGEDLYSSKLQKNILDLESNLRIVTNGKGHENVGVILCIKDEIEYWKAVGLKKDTNKKERETASFFSILFEDISEEIRSLQSSSLLEIRDSAENIAAILDDVWRYTTLPYSEDRMMHIFDIIGHIVCSVIQKAASQIDLWETHDSTEDNAALIFLSEALNIVQTWINGCKSLTEIYWPNYALHPWKGKPYIPIFCSNFEARLKEIHNIRSTYNQLIKLLTKNEKEELNSDGLLKHFRDINIWICNGPNQSWESASTRFAADLRPAEAKIAEKLKPRMQNTTTKQMLYEFIRYKSLINRPLVKHALSNELELFVGSLLSMLKSIHNALDSDQLDVDVKMHRPAELSPLVQQVQWAKQMEAKVTEIHACTEKYLNDFNNSVEVLKLSSQVLKDLKTMYTQLHEDWAREVQAQLKDGSLQLSGDKPVVEFSASDRLMVVRFEPRLVRVESEARALAALGLPLPATTTSSLQAFTAPLKHARALHQVASFHNTLGERMIPSTRPMMLQAALELASLVQNHQPLYWHLEEQLVNFTNNLKQMVLKLEGQNTYLTGQHLAIRSIVEKLMDTELLAKQSEWKRGIKEIRDIIEKAEVNGYKNTEMWRLHWDLQLYKALECQYIKTLLSLETHFPNIRVDLVLRGRSVCVQPPIEDIRVQHYSQLRRLVSLPSHFTGLHDKISDDKSIFASIVDKHSWLGNKAVAQLESALANLHRVCSKWTQNLALACVDLDALCAEHLKKPSDWEWNFKACKSYGQAVAKMAFDDEKIEWITVGTFTLRREFEAQARNLWAALMSSLQASCREDTLLLDSFMANASVTLENRAMPKNAKELAEISAKQQMLQEKMPEMEKTVEDLKRKSHLLRTWGCDSSLENTVREWQQLREQVQVHYQMFEHQAEIVKTSLKNEWENLHNGIETLVSRWNQAKPRLEDTRDVAYTEMVDRCRSVFDAVEIFNKFETERNELMLECEKFNLNIESSEVWKESENLKAELLNVWIKFKTYNEDYETIAEQEWIVFQKKLHLLDDFIYKWNGLLEPFTSITLYLKQELDRFTELTAALKYLRGSDFIETHWREVFGLLQMEYIKPDALQLKHFLNVANHIKKQMKALQKISTSASSEATIRTILNELEIWYASARLVIIYYTDKSEKLTPIIKDYKDLLTKIEEQQWVVSSVGGSGYMACATWDARLRTARSLVRAAYHAQRSDGCVERKAGDGCRPEYHCQLPRPAQTPIYASHDAIANK